MRCLLTIVAAVAAAGCSGDGDVPEISTDELGIQVFGVVGDGLIRVTATLTTLDHTTGSLIQIPVPEGDQLTARVGDTEVALELGQADGTAPVHTGDLVGASGPELEVALSRGAGESAPSSTVSLPEPFALIDPPASHTRGAPLTLEWEVGVADTVRVLLAAPDCVAGAEVRFDEDLGTATLDAAAFAPTATTAADQPCDAGLQVDRLRDGTADPAFGRGGRVEAAITAAIELEIDF